jgi:hypothetical protein
MSSVTIRMSERLIAQIAPRRTFHYGSDGRLTYIVVTRIKRLLISNIAQILYFVNL